MVRRGGTKSIGNRIANERGELTGNRNANERIILKLGYLNANYRGVLTGSRNANERGVNLMANERDVLATAGRNANERDVLATAGRNANESGVNLMGNRGNKQTPNMAARNAKTSTLVQQNQLLGSGTGIANERDVLATVGQNANESGVNLMGNRGNKQTPNMAARNAKTSTLVQQNQLLGSGTGIANERDVLATVGQNANESGVNLMGNRGNKQTPNMAARYAKISTLVQKNQQLPRVNVGSEGHTENGGRSVRSSNSFQDNHQHMVKSFDDIEEPHAEVDADDYESAGEIPNLGEDIVSQLGKRKRTSKVAAKVAMALEVDEAVTPRPREEHVNIPMNNHHEQQEHPTRENGHDSGHSAVNGSNGEATSKARGQGQRGKYKSFVVDMKLKGKESKLKIFIPDEIDRAIGENARHLVNECGRVVRTRAPLNVKGWKEAFAKAGNAMWKEIEDKFQIAAGSSSLNTEASVIDTMQRLYRLWKARLHYYYKSAKCGKTDAERLTNPPPDLPQEQWEYCVKQFSDPEFKKVSERNSKNRLSDKRCTHTTGNLSFAEFEDLLAKQNNNVKPPADVIWLAQHTHKNEDGVLEWADQSRSKEIHEKMKDVIATAGDSMTQEEMLLEVFPPRSGYFRGKGTALRGYSKGRQQLQHEEALQKQQQKIQEQENMIQEQAQTIKELKESQERNQRELEEFKAQQQRDMDGFRQLLQTIGAGNIAFPAS